jgi:hypothetical protein
VAGITLTGQAPLQTMAEASRMFRRRSDTANG